MKNKFINNYVEEEGNLYKTIGFFKIPVSERSQLDFKDNEKGSVYFLKVGEFIKIGFSSDIKKRVRSLQSSNPIKVELLAVVSGGRKMEKLLHEGFKNSHKCGEFFHYSEDIESYINQLNKEKG